MTAQQSTNDTPWDLFTHRIAEIEALTSTLGLVEWDQQTYMPQGGADNRAQQIGTLSAILHEKTTDPRSLEWAESVDSDGDPVRMAAVKKFIRIHQRANRVPTELVARFAQAGANGFVAWNKAREANDFAVFQPAMTEIVTLVREIIACHGHAEHPYDHLLEDYDPGSTTAQLKPLFERLAGELTPFVEEIGQRPQLPKLNVELSVEGQQRISKTILQTMGFRLDRGRLDSSVHPFTVGMAPDDVRLTTHYDPNDLLGVLGGTIHEGGHGLYEQGLPTAWAKTGLMEAAGMGIHESQSRFWENFIGRSLPFCEWLAPVLTQEWPKLRITPHHLYQVSNRVEPSLVRVKADEATYNLHIIVRFQLELALVTGDLRVSELSDAWNEAYAKIVTVRPQSDLEGVLQDVHWSGGLLGYFPSYTIGNLYAASFGKQMEEDLPNLWAKVSNGEFSGALDWLRNKVHKHGHITDAPAIFKAAVGDRDPVADFMDNLKKRQGALYGIC